MNAQDEIYRDCGKIILISTDTEARLGKMLTYLEEKGDKSWSKTKDNFASLKFSVKIKRLNKYCTEHNLVSADITRMFSSFNEIIKVRNKVAHWGAEYDSTAGLVLKNRNSAHGLAFDARQGVTVICNAQFYAYIGLKMILHNSAFAPSKSYK